MKFIVAFALLAVAAIAAADSIKFIPVLERTEKHDDKGQFTLKYLSADGTSVSEQGVLKPSADGKGFVLVKEGEYSFTAPDGKIYRTQYVADASGFKAIGDHLPKSVVA